MKYLSLVLLFLVACAGIANAASPEVDPVIRKIQDAVVKEIPSFSTMKVGKSIIPGIYEVQVDQHFLYFTEDARYFFRGDLIDFKDKINLSDERRKAYRQKILGDALKKGDVVSFKAKDEKSRVSVFTDIDCTYCRRLHNKMADYNKKGITIDYFFYPRAGKPSPAYDKAAKVWCAEDRNDAMTKAKTLNNFQGKICKETPIDEHVILGRKLNVRGTPYMVLEDGTDIKGFVEPEALLQRIRNSKHSKN